MKASSPVLSHGVSPLVRIAAWHFVYNDLHLTFFGNLLADFKTSFVSKPIHAVDMYQVMCGSLGIQPSQHNGSWSRLEEMWVPSAAVHHDL